MKNFEKIEKILIIVDMVNGFIKEGNMADPYIMRIVEEQKRLLDLIKTRAFIKDTHKENCIEFKRFPVHCLENTSESEIIEELKPYEKESFVYTKNSTNTFYASNFKEDIDKMKRLKEIIVTGCCTDICVLNLVTSLQTYFDEQNRNTKIIVPMNAVETYNSDNHKRDEYNEIAFKIMNQTGIKLVKKYGGNHGK